MDIKVKILKKNKDGSADAEVNFDKEGLETLIQWGLVGMLKEAVDEYATSKQIKARARAAAAKTVNKRKPAAKKTPTIKGKVK
jgi:hypothetical protein